jgi:hypothetical protein
MSAMFQSCWRVPAVVTITVRTTNYAQKRHVCQSCLNRINTPTYGKKQGVKHERTRAQ